MSEEISNFNPGQDKNEDNEINIPENMHGQGFNTELADINNKSVETIISPEIQEVLNKKRQELLMGQALAFRFMSLEEYRFIMDNESSRIDYKEVNVEPDIRDLFSYFEAVRNDDYRNFSDGEAWGYIGDRYVGHWDGFRGSYKLKKIVSEYKTKNDSLSKGEGNIQTAREQLADQLKDMVSENINKIDLNKLHPGTHDNLKVLLEKPSNEFTLDDIKYLTLYCESDGIEAVDYQVLTFWSANSHKNDPTRNYWARIDENPKQLLAVMPIINNNVILNELTKVCQESIKHNVSNAHLVLNIKGIGIFPNTKDDLPSMMTEMENSSTGRKAIMERRRELFKVNLYSPTPRELAYLHEFSKMYEKLNLYGIDSYEINGRNMSYIISELYNSILHGEYYDYEEIQLLLKEIRIKKYSEKQKFIETLSQQAAELGKRTPQTLINLIGWLKE